jgi:hypothetical protein
MGDLSDILDDINFEEEETEEEGKEGLSDIINNVNLEEPSDSEEGLSGIIDDINFEEEESPKEEPVMDDSGVEEPEPEFGEEEYKEILKSVISESDSETQKLTKLVKNIKKNQVDFEREVLKELSGNEEAEDAAEDLLISLNNSINAITSNVMATVSAIKKNGSGDIKEKIRSEIKNLIFNVSDKDLRKEITDIFNDEDYKIKGIREKLLNDDYLAEEYGIDKDESDKIRNIVSGILKLDEEFKKHVDLDSHHVRINVGDDLGDPDEIRKGIRENLSNFGPDQIVFESKKNNKKIL